MSSVSSNNNVLYILTILECSEKIKIYADSFDTTNDFFTGTDQMPFNACCHLLLAIGEESKKISEGLKDNFSFVEWDRIAGIRNRIAHDYRGIDAEIVFHIIKNELSVLNEVMIKMLISTGTTRAEIEKYIQSDYYKHLKYLPERF